MPGISAPVLAATLAINANPATDGGTVADGEGSPFADILNGQIGAVDMATLLPMLLGERVKGETPPLDIDGSTSADDATTAMPSDLANMLAALASIPAQVHGAGTSATRREDSLSGQAHAEGLATALQSLARGSRRDTGADLTAGATALKLPAATGDDAGDSASTAAPTAILAANDDALDASKIIEAKSAVATRLSASADPGVANAALQASVAGAPVHAAITQTGPSTGFHIATPLGSARWGDAVGDTLVIMAGQQQNRAELVLTPPQLGRVEISLTMTGDQASAIFASANPAVREALESALPRLQELLADAGITLSSQVGSELPREAAKGDTGGEPRGRSGADDPASGRTLAVAVAAGAVTGSGRGLVDVFA